MLLKRIIPCLDVDRGRVVKGVRYVDHVDAGDPVEVARRYDAQEADEITFLDITASHEERGILLDVVARTAETVFMPLCVGGGVRSLADVRDLLNAGADKVSIMTAAVQNPDLVAEAAVRIGSANLVVAIDAKRIDDWDGFRARAAERYKTHGDVADCLARAGSAGAERASLVPRSTPRASEVVARAGSGRAERVSPVPRSEPQASEAVARAGSGGAERASPVPRSEPQASEAVARAGSAGAERASLVPRSEPLVSEVVGWEIHTHGGRRPTGIDAVAWARRMARAGAGEILLTSMDRDGTRSGYDLALVRAVADAVPVPVIASGGGGSAESLAEALDDGPRGGHAQAALAASIFHFGEATVGSVKRRLLELGIAVRAPRVVVSAEPLR